MKPTLRPALLAVLLLLAPVVGSSPAEIPLKLPSGRTYTVELMVKDEDRAMGLMYRRSLDADRALLFIFERADFHGIWMKNCRFPIDIVWLDAERRVVDVKPGAPPCKQEPCEVYTPLKRASYVVEMNSGQAKKEKLDLGAQVEFTLPR